jgi:glycosyltransferase involved in cell wall biosynthesis
MEKLLIISNEKIHNDGENFYCDNIDLKSTPEGLSKSFLTEIVARKSKIFRSFRINFKVINIKIYSNIFSYLSKVIKTSQKKNIRILIISITPYTFLASVILFLLRRKHYVYLRSDGHEEYKKIFGMIGPSIYGFMFFICSKISKLISCSERILRGKKGNVIYPSQLSKIATQEPKLLYVGRVRKEKGIFSIAEILKNDPGVNLSIVGADKSTKSLFNQKNIKVHQIEDNEEKLIKIYDDHNIFLLPSFTEGYPMVLLEALSRLRPVIIFKEIAYVADKKNGVFICDRNLISLKEKINYILRNYTDIQKQIEKNKLPTKEKFILDLSKILSSNG